MGILAVIGGLRRGLLCPRGKAVFLPLPPHKGKTEEAKKLEAEHIQAKAYDFIQLAERIDRQVAANVDQNREALFSVNPWLKPTPSVAEEIPWYEKAWSWLCDAGEAIDTSMRQTWNWVKDTARKAWAGLIEYEKKRRKSIIKISLAVGATIIAFNIGWQFFLSDAKQGLINWLQDLFVSRKSATEKESIPTIARVSSSAGISEDERHFIADFETANPEIASRMNKDLSDPDLSDSEREEIKYIAYQAPEPYRTIYFEHLDEYVVNIEQHNEMNNPSSYNQDDRQIYIRDKNMDLSSDSRGPYQTFFHESGHAVDDYELSSGYATNSYVYNRKTLHDLVVEDTRSYVEDYIDKDLIYRFLLPAEKKYILDCLNLTDDSSFDEYGSGLFIRYGFSKRIVTSDFKGPVNATASDVFGGVTNNAIMGDGRHTDKYYWYDESGQATGAQERELWADFFSAQMRQDKSALASIKRYFPRAYEAMEAMAHDMANSSAAAGGQ